MFTCLIFQGLCLWRPLLATQKLPDWPQLKLKATRLTMNFDHVSRMCLEGRTKKRGSPLPTSIRADRAVCCNGNGERSLNFTNARVRTRHSTCSELCKTFPIIPFS